MANGDDFDPNPPGTMTPSPGLSPDDPLYDWGSNIHPSQLQQYVHDPEGFKQNMVDQNIPPPDHHYTTTADGTLQAYDPDTKQPVYRSVSATGSGFPEEDQTARPMAAGAGVPPFAQPKPPVVQTPPGAPGTASSQLPPTWGGSQGSWGPEPNPLDITRGKGAQLPVTPQPQPKSQERIPQEVPMPAPRPLAAGPRPGQIVPGTGGGGPMDIRSRAQKRGEAEEGEDKTKKVGEGLSEFGKSLAGVKVPPKPEGVKVSTPSVRGPVGIQAPQIASLLALIGAHAPTAVPSLMRLLGRA